MSHQCSGPNCSCWKPTIRENTLESISKGNRLLSNAWADAANSVYLLWDRLSQNQRDAFLESLKR
jgi:hypothetical protein